MLEGWKRELETHQIRLTSSAGGVEDRAGNGQTHQIRLTSSAGGEEERAGNPSDKAHL